MTEPTILRTLLVHADDRGSVRETYRASWLPDPYRASWLPVPPVVQLVHSRSKARVMRAMHAHKLQWDIWHFTAGQAFVQLYDHRTGEHTAQWVGPETTLFIPPGVSHGFYTPLGCTLMYALTREYDGTDEYGWLATSPEFPGTASWGFVGYPIVSDRDRTAPSLKEFADAW